MKRALTLGVIMCLWVPTAAWGQTAGEDYTGQKMQEKQAPSASAEVGPLAPYRPRPEGPPMIEGELPAYQGIAGELPAYQGQLKEAFEENFTEGEARKKTLEPTSQQKKEMR
jgi:hypothetical protein